MTNLDVCRLAHESGGEQFPVRDGYYFEFTSEALEKLANTAHALGVAEQATGSTYQEGYDDAQRMAHKHIKQLREELTKALAKGVPK